ncbi:MAG: site-specific DNA-methyltransferase [Deltaproteobacteria bacterium]|nr:site-specific DNA-methyltransferase [Deltaproteobacteria bacterium]
MRKTRRRKHWYSRGESVRGTSPDRVKEDIPQWDSAAPLNSRRSRTSRVANDRRYAVTTVADAKKIAQGWLGTHKLENVLDFGLPEVDDRYHVWRIPLTRRGARQRLGEIVLDAYTSLILAAETTKPEVIEARLLGRSPDDRKTAVDAARSQQLRASFVRNTVILGDCEQALREMPTQSVDLIFTSPPYFNARPEYEDYVTYDEYLLKMRGVIRSCHQVLSEGRFLVMNVSPVLVRRATRSQASRRLAVPFDMHKLFEEEGFDFVDDIIWVKPEGAGWATGRGRRFAADRNPLQYKPVPVTEYVLVYRKHTDKLIDWNIRAHPDQAAVRASKISGDYDTTNIWRIHPAHNPEHPAVFPLELAQKIVRYYSFINDVVLDPFGGVGTTAMAAVSLGRRFVLIENEPKYVDVVRREIASWMGRTVRDVLFIGCEPPDNSGVLL